MNNMDDVIDIRTLLPNYAAFLVTGETLGLSREDIMLSGRHLGTKDQA